MPQDDGVEVRILGPLRLVVDGAEVPIGAARERRLLARLALDAGEVVAEGRLIDELWGDRPPASARGTLQTYVSHLRRAVAPATIARDGDGYRLCGVVVDAHRLGVLHGDFELADGDPRRLEALLAAAEELVGGARPEVLSDLGDGAAASAARARLDEERLVLVEDVITARVALGRGEAVIGWLEELRAAHPLRERLAALQMEALYRSGRQADALAVYRSLRADLVEQLGIEPSAALRDLEVRVLAQDPALSPSPAATSTGPGADPPATRASSASAMSPLPLPPRLVGGRRDTALVGRRGELDELTNELERAERGEVPDVCLVVGEAGIGKTRVARELALVAAGRRDVVLWGRCTADGGGAFHAVAEALDHLVRHRPALADGLEGGLANLVPTLAAAADPLRALGAVDEQRFALLAGVAELLGRAAGDSGALLVLDDLQWADVGTLAVFEHLHAHAVPGLLVVATVRVPEPMEAPTLAAVLARIDRDRALRRVGLDGLGPRELRVLLDRATGSAAAESSVAALHAQTGGNPFFVGELLAELGEGAAELLSVGSGRLPDGVYAVLGQRLDHLSPAHERLLAAAAALGADFDLAAVCDVAGAVVDQALDALEAALGVGLIEEGAGEGRFSFCHALVLAAVRRRVSSARWSRLEAKAAEVASARAMERPGQLGQRLAGRLLAGDPGRDVGADPRVTESRVMLHRLSGASPVEGQERHDPVTTFPLTNARAGRTVLRLTDALIARGERDLARRRALEAVELAERLGDDELLVDAALVAGEVAGLRCPGLSSGAASEVVAAVATAAGRAGDSLGPDDPRRAALLIRVAVAALTEDRARAAALASAAIAAAARLGQPVAQAEAQLVLRCARWAETSAPERLSLVERATALLDGGVGGSEAEVRALSVSADLAACADHLAEGSSVGARERATAVAAAADAGDPVARRWVPLVRAGLDLWDGRVGEAVAELEAASALDAPGDQRRADDPLGILLLLLARAEGRLAAGRLSLTAMAERWPAALLWRAALAAAQVEAGELGRARAVLDEVAAVGLTGHHRDETWLGGVALLAEPVAASGHRLALEVSAALAPHVGEVAVAGWVGAVARVDEALALLEGRG